MYNAFIPTRNLQYALSRTWHKVTHRYMKEHEHRYVVLTEKHTLNGIPTAVP